MPRHSTPRLTARHAVAEALTHAAVHYPHMLPATLHTEHLSGLDARLAMAIHRTVLQRWITIEYLLDLFSRRPIESLEPTLRAIFLSAGAQLLFMDRLPTHAVVDESVNLARKLVRPGAAGLVNAVLRRLAELVDQPVVGVPWSASSDRLPLEDGYVVLRETVLPPVEELDRHLSIATSVPAEVAGRWIEAFGSERAIELCAMGVRTPPTIVASEDGFDRNAGDDDWQPHERPDFVVWRGPHDRLVAFLGGDPARRVQDPASAATCEATRDMALNVVVDYCAGRGTKTRQLAALHPDAHIIATDTDSGRFADLRVAFKGHPRVRVVSMPHVAAAVAELGGADLLLLDVPCSNSGVFARRPEARYRFNPTTLESLVKLQRQIARDAAGLLKSGGHLLYATCSVEAEENQQQARWIAEHLKAEVVRESLLLPGGRGAAYHDANYHALLRV